ncbi:Uncharacterised protein [Streptococcus pneumoniae]|jgi:hypothetical protein|nr:Uncharacterised protein [Streptococcus pneumoniae]COG60643.1 Uncharacterised protein [Streptococcus pneumoniae]COR34489.1 Uncharacterised protein [Streptococcus pneumoniae]CRG02114.1 Uncharacterised protein [Streptococcus pneumoniae]
MPVARPVHFAPSNTFATGRNFSSSFIGCKLGELTIEGNIPTYPEFDLFPVAKAVAAGAESVIADSAENVRTPPVTI